MCYSRISHSKNGLESLQYILEGEGHNGGERNLTVFPIGLADSCVKSYYEQCEELWARASSRNLTRARNLIISFSPKELDPKKEESVIIAQQIAMEICERAYPGHAFVCAVQSDGRGGKLHMHLVSPNVNTINYKGFADEQTRYWYLRQITDDVCSKYFELDEGEKSYERKAKTLRGMREANEKIKEENASLPIEEQKPLKYIWRDDVQERVLHCMQGVRSYDEFFDNLKNNGVDVETVQSKKRGTFFGYILTDTSKFTGKIPDKLHARSYRLGDEYGIAALDAEIEKNTKKEIVSADAPEPELSHHLRPKPQASVMITAQDRDNIGSVSIPSEPRRSNKRRGKISASEQPWHEPSVPPAPKRKLPRRDPKADIKRMIDILEADAKEIRDAAPGDIDIDLIKRNPRRP